MSTSCKRFTVSAKCFAVWNLSCSASNAYKPFSILGRWSQTRFHFPFQPPTADHLVLWIWICKWEWTDKEMWWTSQQTTDYSRDWRGANISQTPEVHVLSNDIQHVEGYSCVRVRAVGSRNFIFPWRIPLQNPNWCFNSINCSQSTHNVPHEVIQTPTVDNKNSFLSTNLLNPFFSTIFVISPTQCNKISRGLWLNWKNHLCERDTIDQVVGVKLLFLAVHLLLSWSCQGVVCAGVCRANYSPVFVTHPHGEFVKWMCPKQIHVLLTLCKQFLITGFPAFTHCCFKENSFPFVCLQSRSTKHHRQNRKFKNKKKKQHLQILLRSPTLTLKVLRATIVAFSVW